MCDSEAIVASRSNSLGLDLLLTAEREQLSRHRPGALGGPPDLLDVGVGRMRRPNSPSASSA